jgi:RimJ/RimL family protein N-acetyltransferase
MTLLGTRRLVLRQWTDSADDLAFLFDMYSRDEVQRYIGVTPRLMQDIDEARERVERWRDLDDGVRGVWGVTLPDGRRLGTVLCKRIPWSAGAAPAGAMQDTEVGWHFHPDAWGHGYAGEAATAALRRAFGAGLDRVVAVTNPANTASRSVCLRIGMSPRGLTTSYYDTTCELFELAAPGRRCVAFFRNVNQGQRGHPSTQHLVDAMRDARFSAIEGFRANGTLAGTAVGAPEMLASDTAAALSARSGLDREVFVMPLADVADIVEAFAPDERAGDDRLELSVFDPRVAIDELPARGVRCDVIASGRGWAVTRNDDAGRSQGTPTIERLIGVPVTSRGMSTIRALVGRSA